ncbi:glycosyltransferase, partial [Enterococcus faecalis]|uniref:glycosyltransferase n=1 Tax=Enterococcus faecalis TaxID=1351 RepID=UPI00403F3C3B
SLYHQTLHKSRFEVIIANNNSTDNTKAIVEEYILAHTDANFIYVEELQQGASYARNTGAALATSPLLCFMDDDAIAEKDYLERIVNFF